MRLPKPSRPDGSGTPAIIRKVAERNATGSIRAGRTRGEPALGPLPARRDGHRERRGECGCARARLVPPSPGRPKGIPWERIPPAAARGRASGRSSPRRAPRRRGNHCHGSPATKLALASGRSTISSPAPPRHDGALLDPKRRQVSSGDEDDRHGAPGGSGTRPISVSTWTLSDGKNVYTLNPMVEKQVLRMKVLRTGPQANNVAAGLGGCLARRSIQRRRSVWARKSAWPHLWISDLDTARVWVWQGLPLRIETKPAPPAR